MKRMKRVLCLLLAGMLCLSLCGCDDLEEARANHALWQADGTILLRDTVYRQLPSEMGIVTIEDTASEGIHLTDPEVPVLLATRYGDYTRLLQDGLLLRYYDTGLSATRYYCPAERYEEIIALLEACFPADGFYYHYYKSLENGVQYYDLTPEENAAIKAVVIPLNRVTLDQGDKYAERSVTLHYRSGCLRLRGDQVGCEILQIDGIYYVSVAQTAPVLYRAPDDLQETFAGMMAAAME